MAKKRSRSRRSAGTVVCRCKRVRSTKTRMDRRKIVGGTSCSCSLVSGKRISKLGEGQFGPSRRKLKGISGVVVYS